MPNLTHVVLFGLQHKVHSDRITIDRIFELVPGGMRERPMPEEDCPVNLELTTECGVRVSLKGVQYLDVCQSPDVMHDAMKCEVCNA